MAIENQTAIQIARAAVEGMKIPIGLAQKADDRAQQIFMHANRFGKTFKECLGEIYMTAVLAGVEAAMLREQRLEDVTND